MSVEQCEHLRQLSEHFEYQAVIAVKFVLCAMGACAISYQWYKLGVRFLVHDNTKIIFCVYYALHLCTVLVFAIIFLFELIRLRYVCFVIQFRTVLLSKGIAISAVFAAHYVILIISIERVYSALFPAHFEMNSNKAVAFFLSISTV
ncbi:hypothetical protein PENTCL1PPCAC_16383, partial [Pristionchus entomophagus]